MENLKKETFNYTYSAKEQEEIKAIRKKYASPEQAEDKMAQLRRLDASVTRKATTGAIVIGVVGALIMGLGMSLIMTDLGKMLNTSLAMILGVAVGAVGVVLVCMAYPFYSHILKKERKKVAPQILRLTDELMR